MYMEDNKSVFLDGKDNEYDFKWNERWNSAEEYREQYDHPVWKKYLAEGVRGGHDGMDWLVFRSFFDAAKAGAPAPIDVYDAAAWMSISCLSEQSVAMGGAPCPFRTLPTASGWSALPGSRKVGASGILCSAPFLKK